MPLPVHEERFSHQAWNGPSLVARVKHLPGDGLAAARRDVHRLQYPGPDTEGGVIFGKETDIAGLAQWGMPTARNSLVSTEHARSRFAPHGEVLITSGGELIRFDVHGPFNAEALQALGYAMAQLLMSWTPKGPFATISYWHGSMLASADALEAYRGVLRQGRKLLPREVTNAWFVPPSVEGRALMEAHWRRLYAECDYPLEIFDTEADALACVQQRLLAATA